MRALLCGDTGFPDVLEIAGTYQVRTPLAITERRARGKVALRMA